jgi:DNA-directed RNA polymerase subunit M/transcription elongation factor TFIIS
MSIKFCSVCDMYYYTRISETDGNRLSYYCRSCGNVEDTPIEGACVLDTRMRAREQTFRHIVNPYTKYDPTIPSSYDIPCPEAGCASNHSDDTKVPREVKYIRYDNANMKYLYICMVCDATWKTPDTA